jgi:hypothetical protein
MTNINATDLAHAIVIYIAVSTVILFFVCRNLNGGNYRPLLSNLLLGIFFPPASPFYMVSKVVKMVNKRSTNRSETQ